MSREESYVEEYSPLVRSLARKVRDQFELNVDLDDLVAFGFEGLVDARTRYDPSRGVQFNTFAYYRIRGAILDGVRKGGYLPRRAYARLRAAEAALTLGEQVGEERAAAQQAAAPAGNAAAALRATVARLTASYTIASVGQTEDQTERGTPEQVLINKESRERVRSAMRTLPEREMALLAGFYFEGRRFDEVAEELGISKSWASRLHQKALDRLREALEAH